jgi:hypothetical protein
MTLSFRRDCRRAGGLSRRDGRCLRLDRRATEERRRLSIWPTSPTRTLDLKRVAGRTPAACRSVSRRRPGIPTIDQVAGLRRRRRPVAESGRHRAAKLKPRTAAPTTAPVRVAGDTTAGFTRQEGVVRLELPADLDAARCAARRRSGWKEPVTFRLNSTTTADRATLVLVARLARRRQPHRRGAPADA